MSCVIEYADYRGVVFVGDGRAIDSDKNIISESCKKVMRINDNVIYGYAGDLKTCLCIASILVLTLKRSMVPINEYKVDSVVSLVDSIALSLREPIARFSFLVGGVNSDGRFSIHSVDMSESLVFSDYFPPAGKSCFVVCSPSREIDVASIVEYRLYSLQNDCSVEERMQQAISDVADLAPSVNRVFYTEEVVP